MGLINWIFDFYQQYRIDEIRGQNERLRAEAAVRGPTGQIDQERLERALGEIALAVKTVRQVMIDKGVCSAEEFHNKLRQVDLDDGRADGRTPIP
ncbi:MAG: hypothetical protein OEQ13_02970 [Acidobacteriota bacterium]|nr:hypothetical protein [Acidobacteriota bacterium]